MFFCYVSNSIISGYYKQTIIYILPYQTTYSAAQPGFMADCIKESTHLVIRNVGHLTNLEAPAVFNAAVKRFLAR